MKVNGNVATEEISPDLRVIFKVRTQKLQDLPETQITTNKLLT